MGAAALDAAMPLVLVGQVGRRRDVVAANSAAIQAGLRVGMAATQAQALVKELVIQDADPAADAEALEGLAIWALRCSPIVASDNPDGLIIDATGASHLHGGEEPMLAELISRLEAVGITARATAASATGFFALATARMPQPGLTTGFCMGYSDDPSLRRTPVHVALLVPARSVILRTTVFAGSLARHSGIGGRRPQQSSRHCQGP
jgi:protein ImuB